MCKAIIQIGPRKGESCQFPAGENGYCERHHRNYVHELKLQDGKHLCRFFFRGCDTEITEEEHVKGVVTCKECRAKLQKKEYTCEHDGCTFKVKEAGFCKKHERDKYKKEEQEKGIRYCDIARGCFNLCEEEKVSCKDCLEKTRQTDMERRATRRQLTGVLQNTIVSNSSICVKCGKDYETFMTRYNNPSKKCKKCTQIQKNQDAKRVDRERNYKKEHAQNLEQYYKVYITKSSARDRGIFSITFDEFCILVTSPCYYCKHIDEDETNGIDRLDNDKGYTQENCVPCCATCNRMKHFYHPSFFIQKCKQISKESILNEDFIYKWNTYYTRTNTRNYYAYKSTAVSRDISFNLTETQYYNLTMSPCYLCNFQYVKGIGLDRVDNSIREYSIHNVKPCCGTCNDMKHALTLEEFINKCKQVSDTWFNTKEFDSIPIPKNPLKEYFEKGRVAETKDRKHWKALGLYYALLSSSTEGFEEAFAEVLKEGEIQEFKTRAQSSEKEVIVKELQTFIQMLKKRKQRIK